MHGVIFGLVFVSCVAAGLVAVSEVLRRRLRLVPGLRSTAPVTWLCRLHGSARCHRRLRRALRGAYGALDEGKAAQVAVSGLAACLDELVRHADVVDRHLVVAARFGLPIRRTMLRGLRPEVSEIEDVAARIAATVVARASFSDENLLNRIEFINERLDALEAAHQEIADLASVRFARAQPIASDVARPRHDLAHTDPNSAVLDGHRPEAEAQ